MSGKVARLKKFRQLRAVSRQGSTETIEQRRRLRELGQEVNKECDRMHECARGIVRLGAGAVEAALKLGDRLREAKAVCGHGNFAGWLRRNCPRVTHRYANKLMAAASIVAQAERVPDMESIRALFVFCGLMEPAKPGERLEKMFSLSVALAYIKPATRLSLDDVRKLNSEEQQQLRQQLEPVHNIYLALPEHTQSAHLNSSD